MTSSLPSAVGPLAILQAEYMAKKKKKKSEESSSQSACNKEWCRIQPPASMIHWNSFPVSPLKNCHGWAESLELASEHESTFSPQISGFSEESNLPFYKHLPLIIGFWAASSWTWVQ